MTVDDTIHYIVLDDPLLRYNVRRAKVNIYVNRYALVKGSA